MVMYHVRKYKITEKTHKDRSSKSPFNGSWLHGDDDLP